jgi:hypothetical protein
VSLPSESLEALRAAAATREDIARVVLVDRDLAVRGERPPVDTQIVVVLDELPTEPPGHGQIGSLAALFRPALAPLGTFSVAVPSPAGLEPATRDGAVLYEREAQA